MLPSPSSADMDDLLRPLLSRLRQVLEEDDTLRDLVDGVVAHAWSTTSLRAELLERFETATEAIVRAGAADGGPPPGTDRKALSAVAAAAAAVENARLHQRALQREHWLAASAELCSLLTGAAPGGSALQAIADRARELAEADLAWIVASGDGTALALQVLSGLTISDEILATVSWDTSLSRTVVDLGAPICVDDTRADARSLDVSKFGWPEIGPAMIVPLGAGSGIEGVLALAWTPDHMERYRAVDVSLPAAFAKQAALALQLGQAREEHHLLAVLEDRDRIGRDLHDLVIQRLFALGLGLQATARAAGEPDIAQRLETAVDDLDATINDIRRTIFALGQAETTADLQSEVTKVVERAEKTLKFRPRLRFEGPVRSVVSDELAPDLIAVLAEALSNASKHAEARVVSVVVSAGNRLVLTVTDDGKGLPEGVVESGLANIRERAALRGGTFDVVSSPGQGTKVTWAVPTATAEPSPTG